MQNMIIVILSLVIFIGFLISRSTIRKLKEEAKRNLGRPDELDNIENMFFGSNAYLVVIHFFVKTTDNEKEFTEMTVGYGLISHPDFSKDMHYFKLVFRTGEDIVADGKTEYSIRQEISSGIFHLHKN